MMLDDGTGWDWVVGGGGGVQLVGVAIVCLSNEDAKQLLL